MVATDHWLWKPWHVPPIAWSGAWQVVKEEPIPHRLRARGSALDDMLSRMPKARAGAPVPRSVFRKSEDIAALALLLPILGYALLFWVWPWIYRGF